MDHFFEEKSIVADICSRYGISLMVLFGSHAKGQARVNSDIDIAVLFGDVIRPYELELNDLREKVIALYDQLVIEGKGAKVDIALLNYGDPLLWYEVSQHGKVLYENKEGQFRTFCIRALQRHNDARRFYQAEKEYLTRFLEGDHFG